MLTNLSCDRPISVLPYVSKNFEKLINKQLIDHLETHNVLNLLQSGFRLGHSCITSTFKVVNDIVCAINKKEYCAAVFIDLAKVFDSVDHSILLGRLGDISMSECCIAWFKTYCSVWRQSVRVEAHLSDPQPISKGIPQGSILVPTLFSVCNNVSNSVNNCLVCTHLYTNDTISGGGHR